MSIEISVSQEFPNNENKLLYMDNGCNHIIDTFLKTNLEAKFVPNISVFNNKIESGCSITMGKEYNSKDKLREIWNIIKKSLPNEKEYICSHIKIDGIYQGCIYNYLQKDLCPHNNS
tara:strand:+ start:192 stop:542 length:351 start_codon:yes stop_codon:yes gene_type:complete